MCFCFFWGGGEGGGVKKKGKFPHLPHGDLSEHVRW